MGVGFFPMPYGYYTLVKLVTCGFFLWVAVISQAKKETAVVILSLLVALLYNPIFPVYLDSKPAWMVVNIVTLAFATVCLVRFRSSEG